VSSEDRQWRFENAIRFLSGPAAERGAKPTEDEADVETVGTTVL